LRKYLRYAKQHVHPRLTEFDTNRITQLYVELREQSARTGGIPITVRHVESIVRMSEAHAKMHLRQVVNQSDVDMAIRVMLQSFIETQKFQVMNMLRKKFKKFITYKRDNNELLFFLLKNLITEQIQMQAFAQDAPEDFVQELGDEVLPRPQPTRAIVNVDSLLERAKEYEIDNVEPFLSSGILRDNGFVWDAVNRVIIRE
jgi:DNA replication licensing factor MCM2